MAKMPAISTVLGMQVLEALGIETRNVLSLNLRFEPGAFVIATVETLVDKGDEIVRVLQSYEVVEREVNPAEEPPTSAALPSVPPEGCGRPAC